MNTLRKCAAAALFAVFGLSAGAASAADYTAPAGTIDYWYIEALLGGALPLDRDITVNAAPATYDPSGGFTGALAFGRTFGDNVRVELAGSWTRATDGTVTLGGAPLAHTGDINVFTLMVNGLWSFDIGSVVRPFVGLGVGLAVYDMDNFGAVAGAFVFDDSDTVPAGALHLGFDVPLGGNVIFTGRYALVATGDADFTSTDGLNTASKDSDVDHVFLAGVRIPLWQ